MIASAAPLDADLYTQTLTYPKTYNMVLLSRSLRPPPPSSPLLPLPPNLRPIPPFLTKGFRDQNFVWCPPHPSLLLGSRWLKAVGGVDDGKPLVAPYRVIRKWWAARPHEGGTKAIGMSVTVFSIFRLRSSWKHNEQTRQRRSAGAANRPFICQILMYKCHPALGASLTKF